MRFLRRLAIVSTWRCSSCGQWYGPDDSDQRPVCFRCKPTPIAA